ncbi:MAG: hypothetical protein IJ356_09070 [Erysipelotrichaceae bacterium]|nr:hypothetical protein [Erysipelotrichaceae bacterium]
MGIQFDYSVNMGENVISSQLTHGDLTVNLFFSDTDESIQSKLIHLVQNQN